MFPFHLKIIILQDGNFRDFTFFNKSSKEKKEEENHKLTKTRFLETPANRNCTLSKFVRYDFFFFFSKVVLERQLAWLKRCSAVAVWGLSSASYVPVSLRLSVRPPAALVASLYSKHPLMNWSPVFVQNMVGGCFVTHADTIAVLMNLYLSWNKMYLVYY